CLKLRKGAALDLLKPFLKKGLKNPKNFRDGSEACFVSGFHSRARMSSFRSEAQKSSAPLAERHSCSSTVRLSWANLSGFAKN
ncbi:MAG: hypothetical protein IKM31_01825, partial [Oscillospiraceae bacterium]|nr:hypothetical protein [Oscillospiraceae bacterium]